MNPIKHFFQVDLPATFSMGKLRIAVMQLNSQLAQLQKQKEPIINELGVKAWDGRVRDISYEKTYGKLEELDTAGGKVQTEIDETQNLIQQENTSLNTITEEFNVRVKEIQDQRQPAMQELGELQTQQRGIEKQTKDLQTKIEQATTNIRNMELQASQLSLSTQPDKETKIASLRSTVETLKTQINEANGQVVSAKEELETNQDSQKPIKDQVEGYNQLTKMEQDKFKSTSDPILNKIAALQQNISKLREKKNGLNQRILVLIPDLGKEVSKYRPIDDLLTPVYEKLDAKDNEIKAINDQINLSNARLASVGSKSVKKVAFVGGALALLTICLIGFVMLIPTVTGFFTPDPKTKIHLVESWTIENCASPGSQGNYLDISVWENLKKDSTAGVNMDIKLIGSSDVILDIASDQFEIGPGGSVVSFGDPDPQGSRVQDIQRTISSVTFYKFELGRAPNINVQTFIEKVKNSDNITLGLEISNMSDFGISIYNNRPSYALVINAQNEVIDVLAGNLSDQSIAIDSMSTVAFQSIGYSLGACQQTDYSQEKVTFWYFVPLQITTNTSNLISLSGKVPYTP